MQRRRLIGSALAGAALAATTAVPAHAGHGKRVRTGIEVLAEDDFAELAGQRVGVISNPTGVLPDLSHEVDLMHESGKVDIVAVFGPEHGFRGVSQAGEGEDFFLDPKTGIPVYNAYNNKDQMAELLVEAGVETLVFDIQDVGLAVLHVHLDHVPRSGGGRAARAAVRGARPAQPGLGGGGERAGAAPEHATFVGLKPIAQRHGMTVGELASLFNGEFLTTAADLKVVTMRGWKREMYFEDTGLPWVAPSPNMPTVDDRGGLSGDLPVRGDRALGGARHDQAVRAARRARDRPHVVGGGAGAAGDALPRGVLHAHVLQVGREGLRRRRAAGDLAARLRPDPDGDWR